MVKKLFVFHAFLLQLFYQGIAQNVGIRNTNPSFPLDVSGQIRIRGISEVITAGMYLNKIDNSSPQAFIGMRSDSFVGLYGVPLAKWGMLMNTTTGNLGIGNENPSFLLDVSGQVRIRSKDALNTAGIYLNKIDNSSPQAFIGMRSDSYVGLYGVPLANWGMLMNTTTGNLGIGNENPSFLLDVSGQVRIRSKDAVSTAGLYLNKIDNSGVQAFVGMHSDSYVGLFGVPLNGWGFLMNTTSGNLGIGNANPSYLLDVSGRVRIRSKDAVNTAGIYFNKIDNSSTQAFVGMQSDAQVGLFAGPLNNWGLLMNTTNGNIGIIADANIGGTANITGNANITGEVRRPPTGTANLVPICYGSVNLVGTILSGSGNFSVAWSGTSYDITIAGETYANGNYISIVTPQLNSPRMATTGANNDALKIYIWDLAGNTISTNFSFVVYKP